MSVAEFVQRIATLGPNDPFDVRAIRDEIHALYLPATPKERDTLQQVFHAAMDLFERKVKPDDLQEVRKLRESDYNLLLIIESTDSDGNISPVKYLAATSREVAAGRMSPDNKTHRLALAGQLLVTPQKPKKPGLLKKLFGR